MKALLWTLAVVPVIGLGCSGGSLSREAASKAIETSFQNAHISLLLKFGRVGTNCADKASGVVDEAPTTNVEYIAAREAGLVTVARDGDDYWKIALVGLRPSVLETVKQNHRYAANGCDYQLAQVPVADKSLLEVTRIDQVTDVTAQAEVKWKWTLTPEGEKLVGKQPPAQIAELDWRLDNNILSQPNSSFTLTDIAQTTAPRDGKVTLNKTKEGWRVLEPPPKIQPVPTLESFSWLTDAEIAKLAPADRENWAAARGDGWTRTESINSKDGNKTVALAIWSRNKILAQHSETAVLLTIACGEDDTLLVNAGPVHDGSVRLKFDDAAPVQQKWYPTDTSLGTLNSPLLKRFLTATSVKIEFTPVGRAPQVAIFDMANLKALVAQEEVCKFSRSKS